MCHVWEETYWYCEHTSQVPHGQITSPSFCTQKRKLSVSRTYSLLRHWFLNLSKGTGQDVCSHPVIFIHLNHWLQRNLMMCRTLQFWSIIFSPGQRHSCWTSVLSWTGKPSCSSVGVGNHRGSLWNHFLLSLKPTTGWKYCLNRKSKIRVLMSI